jgi:hypothetical protein
MVLSDEEEMKAGTIGFCDAATNAIGADNPTMDPCGWP